jgi:hypothetical protein
MYESFFGDHTKFREKITRELAREIESEVSIDILSAFPILRAGDKDKVLDLMRTGLKKFEIAQVLGYSSGRVGNLVKEIIRKDFPELPIYKPFIPSGLQFSEFHEKTSPSFEDLQDYLMGEFILGYIYQGFSRGEILSKFVTKENPSGIKGGLFDAICERVLGGRSDELRAVAIEAVLTIILLEKNPRTYQDILDDPRYKNFGNRRALQDRIARLFKIDDYYLKLAEARRAVTSGIKALKITICGPHLHNLYRKGYSDQQILNEFSSAFTLDDIVWLTDAIWGFTPDEARKIFAFNQLG